VFSTCGNVVHLDLPVDETTGHSKGLAFVEFETNEQLRRALETFGTPSNEGVHRNAQSQHSEEPSHGDHAPARWNAQENRRDDFQTVMKRSSKRNSKDKLDRSHETRESGHYDDRNSRFKESSSQVGRAVPDVSYDMVHPFKPSTKRNPHDSTNSSYRPRLHLETERALFVPIRNPIGPTQGARGFAAGRGKLIPK